MKRIFVIAGLLLNINGFINAGFVTLPSEEILQERLSKSGFDQFAETTKIVNRLAFKKIMPFDVNESIVQALYEYEESLKLPRPQTTVSTIITQENRDKLLEIFLKDHPKKLQELKRLNTSFAQ